MASSTHTSYPEARQLDVRLRAQRLAADIREKKKRAALLAPIFEPPRTRSNKQLQQWWTNLVYASQGHIGYNRNILGPELFTYDSFAQYTAQYTGKEIHRCPGCRLPAYIHLSIEIDGSTYCSTCFKRFTRPCQFCLTPHITQNMRVSGDRRRYFCNDCFAANVVSSCYNCGGCDLKETMVQLVGNRNFLICLSCRRNFRNCAQCGGWADKYHTHPCDCEPYPKKFVFPTVIGEITNDEPFEVTLPAGTIDPVGLAEIKRLARKFYGTATALAAIDEVEPEWQTKRGSYPKRLAKAMYKAAQVKASEQLLAEIGTIAKAHTAHERSHLLDFTRDLNKPPAYFVNGESCWWSRNHGGFEWSRCAFKSGGGIGVRVLNKEGSTATRQSRPMGRIWLLPLDDRWRATGEVDAYAYVLFNSYGPVSSIEMARMIAFLTAKSYRKVEFQGKGSLEVNSYVGYLVAAPDVCTATPRIKMPKIKMQCDAVVPAGY